MRRGGAGRTGTDWTWWRRHGSVSSLDFPVTALTSRRRSHATNGMASSHNQAPARPKVIGGTRSEEGVCTRPDTAPVIEIVGSRSPREIGGSSVRSSRSGPLGTSHHRFVDGQRRPGVVTPWRSCCGRGRGGGAWLVARWWWFGSVVVVVGRRGGGRGRSRSSAG